MNINSILSSVSAAVGSAEFVAAVREVSSLAPESLRTGSRDALRHVIEGQLQRSIPDDIGERAVALRYASHPPLPVKLAQGIFGSNHTIFGLAALGVTTETLFQALVHYAAIAGVDRLFEDYGKVRASLERLPPHPDCSRWTQQHSALWIRRLAAVNALDVVYKRFEKIPAEGPVVYALFPHASIWPDFFLSWLDSRVFHAADAYNFRDNPFSSQVAFGLLGDLMGQPLVDRKDEARSRELFNRLVQGGADLDIRVAWFCNGTRVPLAFHDDGRQDRAGFFSSMPDKDHPGNYLQTGGATANAVQLARRTGQTVKLIVVTLHGTEFVMPNITPKPPFLQPHRSGRTIEFHVVESLDVRPPTNDLDGSRQIIALGRQMPELAMKDLGIREHLAGIVDRWAGDRKGLGEILRERGSKNPRWYVIADLIRSIHPEVQVGEGAISRSDAIAELIRLLSQETPSPDDVRLLLERVHQTVLRHKYDHPGFSV